MSEKYIKKMLEKYRRVNPARYHMPGHKGTMNPYDVTELSITDDLNDPDSYIDDAQEALKRSYESARSFFMVNGSTGSIHAMLKYAGISSKLPILISRNSHRSILSGCILYNLNTIIVDEKYDDELQAFVFDEDKILKIINDNMLSAVVLTTADYFGRTIDVSRIAQMCERKNILLLCDEAHGAHFHITDDLPEGAMKYADVCVHSPHKTLSALTQCSYIHLSKEIDTDRFRSIIYSIQTSSPSFLLIQSMDNARYCADNMKRKWEKRIEKVLHLEEKINSIKVLKVMGKDWAQSAGYYDKDVTRLVIDVSKIGTGIEIGRMLEEKYKIFMEMYTFKYIVGILTPWDKKSWDTRLYSALKKISKTKRQHYNVPVYPQEYSRVSSIIEANESQWIKVLLQDAEGRIAAEPIGTYPPGVPIILPGEVVSKRAIDYMKKVDNLGGSVFGTTKGYVNCVEKNEI